DWQIDEGVHFLVPCGSTGEAATLTPDEHRRVVEIVVAQARGRVPICAGAGSNDTKRAIALSKAMKEAGATHLLHVSPMYNRPPQRGIVAHFRAIAESTDLPIVVYNVPGRTASNIEAATTLELATIPGIVAIKEASGNLSQISEIIRLRPEGFAVLSGDDALTLSVMALGGEGIISVVSNAIPGPIAKLCDAARAGDWSAARALHHRTSPFVTAAFVESNPLPIKAALSMLGRIENYLRLPLVPMAAQHEGRVRDTLLAAGAS
ncbi:MAG: 4-hydroxy-tetrahydrodipicolinate synthase, partial [Gemmatimonadota bacterium]